MCIEQTRRQEIFFIKHNVRKPIDTNGRYKENILPLGMDCYNFNKLSAKDQINYIYHHCCLLDFDIEQDKYQQNGICLYYDRDIFIEVCFDGLRGDRVKSIKTFCCIGQLSRWYERVDLGSLLSQKEW